MKENILIEHLANADLSFLKVVNKVDIQQKKIDADIVKINGNRFYKQPQNWSNDIKELENYFTNIKLPTEPIKLNQYSTLKNCSLFIEKHLATVKQFNGNITFLPYLNRLQELKQILTINSI